MGHILVMQCIRVVYRGISHDIHKSLKANLYAKKIQLTSGNILWYTLRKPCITIIYLSNRAHVSMVYRLLNHMRYHEQQASDLPDSSKVLSTSQVVYHASKP